MRPHFRTDRQPIDGWSSIRPIAFHCDHTSEDSQLCHETVVNLQRRLAAGEYDKWLSSPLPPLTNRDGKLSRRADRVPAEKVSITKPTDRPGAVFFAPGPEITAGEAAKDRRPACLYPFTLKGIEDLFYAVGHRWPNNSACWCPHAAGMKRRH